MMIKHYLIALILLTWQALCSADPANLLAIHFFSKTPAQIVTAGMSLPQAESVQALYVQRLQQRLGPVVGYKAGLTSPQMQQHFGIDHPVLGTLLRDMLVDSGATLSAKFGARPMAEADLVVRVGDECINSARDASAALACLDAVYPFIELPDLMYAENLPLNAAAVLAVNVGARFGVLGKPIALQPGPVWEKRLGDFHLELLDGKGRPIALGDGHALLGHPLRAVLWLRDALRARGQTLHKGQLLSLGALTPLVAVTPGMTLRARYRDLAPQGPVEVSVHFQ